jgi:hypothetical protein
VTATNRSDRRSSELPALLGLLLLPGEIDLEGLTWQEHREAVEAAYRGDRRLVAVPAKSLSHSGGIATLAEIVHVALSDDGRLAHVELVGVRRIRVRAASVDHAHPRVVVAELAASARPARRQTERLAALIAWATGDGSAQDLDLTGMGPAERIDRLSVHLGISMAVKRAVLRSPTLEGRLRLLEHAARRRKAPSRKPAFFRDAVDPPDDEATRIKALPPEIRAVVEQELHQDDSRSTSHARAAIDTILAIRWHAPPPRPISLRRVRRHMDSTHAGLEELKEGVLDWAAAQEWGRRHGFPAGFDGATALGLVGPAGTGKTTVAASIAAATGRHLETIALGGADDVYLVGTAQEYLHSGIGAVARLLASGRHPSELVIHLDEIDKVDLRSERSPVPVLLSLLDPSQNHAWQDHHLHGVRLDLSAAFFIATANTLATIPAPLQDRMRLLRINAYTREEQIAIGCQYLRPRLLQRFGVGDEVLRVPDLTVESLVAGYPPSEGMRPLEQRLTAVVRRALRQHMVTRRPILVTPELARSWLPAGEAERRIGFQVPPAGVTSRTGPAPVMRRAPAVSPRRRLRRSSSRMPGTDPARAIRGERP